MSKLAELIKELCPDGVEFVEIGSVVSYEQPNKYIVSSTDYNDTYDIPVLTAGQTFILGYTDDVEGIYNASEEKPVIIFDDFTGAFKWVDFSFKIKSSAMKLLKVNGTSLELRYIFYIMEMLNYTSNEHKRLWISKYSKFKIPFPPLPVQCEIVRVLDEMAFVNEELEKKLKAELEARQKQYEYYRNALLTFAGGGQTDSSVRWLKLGDIATEIYRGAGIKRDEVTEEGIQCVRYGEIYTSYNIWFDTCISHTDEAKITSKKYFEKGDILFAITGESVEEIAKSCAYVGDEKCLAGGDIVVMKHKQNPKYLAYALATTNAQMQKSKGKVKSKVVHSSVPAIKEIVIPIPSLEEQQRIVDILDRFDKLCNDLSEGLPAEIAARQKQYEYYRDKLLTFKEKEA